MKIISMRGQSVDMARLIAQNSHQIALGNAGMNANGDFVGKNGVITIAREVIARDYHRANPKAVQQMPLRNIKQEVLTFDTPAQAVAKQKERILAHAQQAQQNVGSKPKRKISDD